MKVNHLQTSDTSELIETFIAMLEEQEPETLEFLILENGFKISIEERTEEKERSILFCYYLRDMNVYTINLIDTHHESEVWMSNSSEDKYHDRIIYAFPGLEFNISHIKHQDR